MVVTYAARNPLAADHGPLAWREAGKPFRKGRIHPQTFGNDGGEVWEPLHPVGLNVLFAGERAADLVDGFLQSLGVLEQLESYACQTGRGTLATGEDYERRVCVQLLDWHCHSLSAFDNVRQKIRMV